MAKRRRIRPVEVVSYAVLVLAALFAILPILWALLTSMKDIREILAYPPVFVPSSLTIENYRSVILGSGFLRYLFNTMLVAAIAIGIVLVAASHCAYAVSRIRFRGVEGLMFLILTASMVPLVSLLSPLYLIWSDLGLYDTYFGMALVFAAWQTPTAVWLIRGFIEAVPYEIEEAAMIDGCSKWKCFYKIVLPIVQPGLVATAIVIFIFIWNDFLIATALTISDSRRLMQVGLYRYLGDLGVDWGRFTAYTILSILPVVAVFVTLQKRLISGLVGGAIKG
ncbi:MAG: carbohydrate ABC transporter permease [Burkholderiaceae bacterium]|nr:carbohydrate ABC transporter permease [Burkholderiaceae bacterium]